MKKVGVVIAATEYDLKLADQSEVVVMAEDESTCSMQYGVFRASWLKRASPVLSFKLGDLVSLNPAICGVDSSEELFLGKCLGSPEDRSWGVVCSVGGVRNGIQRNVEVLAFDVSSPALIAVGEGLDSGDMGEDDLWGGDWETACGKDNRRSLYPSALLQPADRALVVRPGDMDLLAGVLADFLSTQTPYVDVGVLIKKFSFGVSFPRGGVDL